jgi:hypothetical protein
MYLPAFVNSRQTHRWRIGALWVLTVLLSGPAWSETGEIRVYTDEINSIGETSLELHGNWSQAARNAASNQTTVFRSIAEFSYGFKENWEAGLQLPLAYVNGTWQGTGLRAELQYIAGHDHANGAYWGGRGELGYVTPVDGVQYWAMELRPIWGYRIGNWHLVANPAITAQLTGSDQQARFEPAAKLAYQLNADNAVGIEYYLEAGPLNRFLPHEDRSEMLYLIWDTRLGKVDLNMGLGAAMTDASPRQVVKLIVGFPL